MPRNAAGNYTLPLPPVVSGNPIAAAFENGTDSDIAAELTNSLDRNGRGGMLAPFKIADGTVSAPGMAFTQDPDNGIYRLDNDDWGLAVAGALVLRLTSGGVTIPAGLHVSGQVTFDGPMTLSGVLTVTGGIVSDSIGPIGQAAAGQAKLLVSSATVNDAAFMAFNHTGSFAAYFGVDTDNQWKVGGWSMGAASYVVLHEGNSFTLDGAGYLTTPRRLKVGSGDSPSPSYTFHDDPTSGLYLATTATVGLALGGLLKMGWAPTYVSLERGMDLRWYTPSFAGFETCLTNMHPGLELNNGNAGQLTVFHCSDITVATNGGNTGSVFFGNTGTRSLAYDGTAFVLSGPSALTTGSFGVNLITYPQAPFDVRTSANTHMVATEVLAGQVTLGTCNDGFSAWQYLFLGGGGTYVVPSYESTSYLGSGDHRWITVFSVNGVVTGSDARLKTDVADSTLGLDFINTLRPVSYKWITEKNEVTRVPDGLSKEGEGITYRDEVTPVPGTTPHWGLIAQEVQGSLMTAAGLDATGFVVQQSEEDMLSLNYQEFIAPLIKAVQELSAKVAALEAA